MPVLICLRKKLWTRTYSIRDQVPTCPVFTCAKIKSRFGILKNLPSHISRTLVGEGSYSSAEIQLTYSTAPVDWVAYRMLHRECCVRLYFVTVTYSYFRVHAVIFDNKWYQIISVLVTWHIESLNKTYFHFSHTHTHTHTHTYIYIYIYKQVWLNTADCFFLKIFKWRCSSLLPSLLTYGSSW